MSSGASDLDAASLAATQAAKPQSSPVAQIVAASPTPVIAAAATTAPIALSASPVPSLAIGDQRLTTTATFVVTNTLGKGMGLRPAPVARNVGKVWPDGTRMAGLGAEQEAYGWTWRFVQDPDGNSGWMPSNYLVQDDSVPTTRSNDRGLTPPSAPPTLILVPTMADPDSMPTPESALPSTPAVVEVVVTATPTGANIKVTATTQPASGSRLAATTTSRLDAALSTNPSLPKPSR